MDDADLLPGDFYDYQSLLAKDELDTVLAVRRWAHEELEPVALQCWADARFPHEIVPGFAELSVAGLNFESDDQPGSSRLLTGFIAMELARVDSSFGTFFGVHTGLAMGTIFYCGSEEQKRRWLPDMRAMRKIGAFGLTEPHGGSDVAGGLETTARRDGDEWVLNGAKRWIGNATFADLVVIWARDVTEPSDDMRKQPVLGFVVEKGTPGFTATKMEGKLALRAAQNADITLVDVRVPEANRLENAQSFKATNTVLRHTRGGVAWSALGGMLAVYELARKYALEREQFGKPIGSFQLIQDLLARMLGNVTASFGMAVRVAQLQDAGIFRDEQGALAKSFCTSRLRENVAWARELFGGNGILLENKVTKFFNDAEALYSFEGTREINSLIVGRSVTGISAFV
ncbi:acyl-CoA dehydrogenase family protein [Jatrophihabitans sp. YIM 134969]